MTTNPLQDQVWAAMRDSFPDIHRIAKEGTNGSERDDDIVKMVFLAMSGELIIREGDVQAAAAGESA